MYIIATANKKFASQWIKVSSSKVTFKQIVSVTALVDFLFDNSAELLILDLNLPGARDLDILKRIAGLKKKARFILGGMSFTPAAEMTCLSIGVVACCPPTLEESEYRRILSVVSKKGVWLSSAGISALMARLQTTSHTDPDKQKSEETGSSESNESNPLSCLTRRELEIARLINKGCSNKAIAQELDIAERTVKAHLSSVFEKLHVKDRLQLVVLISRHD